MTDTITRVLAAEYDACARAALLDVLRELGAYVRPSLRGMAGSQQLESIEVKLDGRSLLVEAETYIGLSVTGEPDLVALVASELAKRIAVR